MIPRDDRILDLFRVSMNPDAGRRLSNLLTYDEQGRMYVGEGPVTAEFERAFGKAIGLEPAPLAVNSCTSAIDLALHLIGARATSDDDWAPSVISTPMNCTAGSSVIVNKGNEIEWADVDPFTGLISPESIRALFRAGSDAAAVMCVDWGGRSCDYNAIRQVLKEEGSTAVIIQDAAHRFSVDPTNRGDITCWSFGPIKHLSGGGYGGAILPRPEDYERARLLRWYGLDRTSSEDFRCAQPILEAGYKYHMTDDTATVCLANLEIAPANVVAAAVHASFYEWVLDGNEKIVGPHVDMLRDEPWFYDVLVEDQAGFMAYMKERGIATSRVHARNDTHPAYRFPNGPLPGVDAFDSKHVAIPCGWWLSEADVQKVADALLDWSKE